MSNRGLKNQSGRTILDFVIILGIIIVIALIATKFGKVNQARYRDQCYKNQATLDQMMQEALIENELELYQVFSAYTLFDPVSSKRSRLIIVTNPMILDPLSALEFNGKKKMPEKGPGYIEKDLTGTPYANETLCPLRQNQPPPFAVIDYWYVPTQRWFCIHNEFHN